MTVITKKYRILIEKILNGRKIIATIKDNFGVVSDFP